MSQNEEDKKSYEDLIESQRLEKKELIATTQKMKYSVPKNDKKKKKEITSKIEQMMSDLDLKHQEELKEFEISCNGSTAAEESENKPLENSPDSDAYVKGLSSEISMKENLSDCNLPPNISMITEHGKTNIQKLSKAQRRRCKKAENLQKKQAAIAEQDILNLSGKRHIESSELSKKLFERHLVIHEVPSDGNCLYSAIEHQLSYLNCEAKSVKTLREETSKYLLLHKNEFIPFTTNPEAGDRLTDEQYIKFCEDIAKTSTWGGHIEIQALSKVLKMSIEVIQAEGPSMIAGEENIGKRLLLSYHRHAFGLGEHYNSVMQE